MRLPKAGHFSVTLSNNLVEIYAVGAWDKDAAVELWEQVTPIANNLSGANWGIIFDARRWILTTPESQQLIANGIIDLIGKGLTTTAYVLDAKMIKHNLIERTHPRHNTSVNLDNYQRQYFPNYFAALKWLASQGYTP